MSEGSRGDERGRGVGRAQRLVRVFSISRRKVATGMAAALAVAVGYHVVFGANGLTVYEQKRAETQVLRQELESLQRENDAMKGHVDRLENDPNAIEHQAREELHYTRAGEVIYSLPSQPVRGAASEASR